MPNHQTYIQEAIKEAKKSLKEGGIPIGAVLVQNGKIISRGHNRLIQKGSTILHGEMDCVENAGRLKGTEYGKCTLYTTLSPCEMCSGMLLLYKISKVVMGENETLKGSEELLMENGVEVVNLNLPECRNMMQDYIENNSELWSEEMERVGY